MITEQILTPSLFNISGRLKMDNLARAIYHCWDMTVLQKNPLTKLPDVKKRATNGTHGLELAKALRQELIDCAEQITERPVYPIQDIIQAIEGETTGPGSLYLVKIRKNLGIPFSRYKLDLARYYTVRLVMEGIDRQAIADFLNVDLRTVANYMAQAKEHIRLILESNLISAIP